MIFRNILSRFRRPRWKRIASEREKKLNALIDSIISERNMLEGKGVHPLGDLKSMPPLPTEMVKRWEDKLQELSIAREGLKRILSRNASKDVEVWEGL